MNTQTLECKALYKCTNVTHPRLRLLLICNLLFRALKIRILSFCKSQTGEIGIKLKLVNQGFIDYFKNSLLINGAEKV
ncbi:hypothetical protein TW84_15200 [Vibrio neptunius]|nr:hypothetical protein TW84_15200 [Vibrio neptunius]